MDLTDFVSRTTIQTNRIADIVLESLNKTNLSKTPIFSGLVNSILNTKKEGLDTVNWFNKNAPVVMNLFGIGNEVVDRLKFITAYIGAAIAVSFLALFQSSDGMNQSTWPWFLNALSFMTGATFYSLRETKFYL